VAGHRKHGHVAPTTQVADERISRNGPQNSPLVVRDPGNHGRILEVVPLEQKLMVWAI
jgi:hypothetical protein